MTLVNCLKELDLISDDHVVEFHPKTRDRDDIRVMKCQKSGLLFLEGKQQADAQYYKNRDVENDGKISKSTLNGQTLNTVSLQDAQRRIAQFDTMISGHNICDFGTGNGLFMDLAKDRAKSVSGIELNEIHLKEMKERGLNVTSRSSDIETDSLDIVSMFHVLEHIDDPLKILHEIKRTLHPQGRLIVEVPHARDFLIETLKPGAFLDFTFWSEHLVLHTRQTLTGLLKAAGFTNISMRGFQRYGLENHLHWLAKEKPGGHDKWAWMKSEALNHEYESMLQSIDQTDTIIAVADYM